DGRRFQSGGDWGGSVIVSDENGELSQLPGLDTRDRFLDLSDDGALVLAGGAGETTSEITVQTDPGERRGTLHFQGRVARAAFDGRGDVIGWVERDEDRVGPFFRWNIATGTVEKWCDSPFAANWGLHSMSRGGGRLLVWGSTPAHLIDERSGALIALFPML